MQSKLKKKDFDREPGCVPLVKEAFAAMDELYKNQDYKTLSSKFQLCNPIADAAGYNHLLLWLRNAFTIMAMVGFKFDAFKNNSLNKLAVQIILG